MNKSLGMIFLPVFLVFFVVHADEHRLMRVQSVNDFYAKIKPRFGRQLNLSVVLFYDAQLGKKTERLDKDQRAQAKQLRSLVRDQVNTFKQARFGVSQTAFLMVDVARRDLGDLAKEYDVQSLPEIHLFRKGKPLMVDGKPAILVGNFLKNDLIGEPEIIEFVEKHFGKDIEMIIKEQEQYRRELEKAYASAPVYYGGWGWGGWGPYWGGPYWGGYYGPYYGSYYAGRGWRMCAGC